MKPQRLAATALTALVLTVGLSGCTSATATTAQLHIDFGTLRAPVDTEFSLAGCTPRISTAPLELAADGEVPCTALYQLLQWASRAATSVDLEKFSFGDCVPRISGIPAQSGCEAGATAYWSLAVNGNNATLGAGETLLAEGDRVQWTLTALPATPTTPLSLTITPTARTRNATITVSGTVSHAAHLSFTLHHGNETMPVAPAIEANGPWTSTIEIPPGNSTLTVRADDGFATAQARTYLVRLAKGNVQVDFRSIPGHANRNDDVWFDPDSHLSASSYAGQSTPHPEFANVHDLMVAWTAQTGVPVVYKMHASLGAQVMQIDGVGDVTGNSAAFWCYQHNGASASMGITQQEFRGGDAVKWVLAPVC